MLINFDHLLIINKTIALQVFARRLSYRMVGHEVQV